MKHVMIKILNIASIVLLCCTLICGAWVSTHPVEDMAFHAVFSGISVVVAIVVLVVNSCKGKK
ncbi:MAG: hypothetical protein PHD67_04560 [Oscillospiraceae bacterium]|nr:hypothetical protein [Oscillospiraceae bacterium]